MHDWVVSTKDNLEKFKMEFEDNFDLHYCLIYYVYTFVALMVDQRAKNMFLTYWGETGKWQPWFYDNDTSFGINNEGQLVLDYYHEDTDQLGNANVYNGQNSVLWTNFREAYTDEIKETYQNLRNNGLITYDKLVDRFITNGSDKWSESIYNEDSDFKYISMLRSDNDATNLPQVRGSGEEHFRYFVENRLNYCDSKWYASDYANDYISLRIYTPTTWAGVEPNPTITVTPFSDMYAGVRYKANGTLYQERATHGVPVSFSPQGETFESENNETFNDTETAVYGAHQLSSIGDLAPLYCGSVNVANADKLVELKVGDATTGYSNANLHELSVGTNKLLKKIDVQNCPNFASVLDLSNCSAIEEVYAKGSSITGVNFPESGMLRIAQLPATITNFTLKHQLYVESLTFQGYESIKTLWVENCPNVDGFDILSKAKNVDRLRITNVNLQYDTATEMLALAARPIGGIDENGTNIDKMWIDGTCHIKSLTGAEYLEVKEAFPYLTITYDTLVSYLTFMSEDGATELARVAVNNGGDGAYSGTTPTKASTAQYNYTFAGWSKTPGGSADPDALKNVEADRTVYAAFSSTLRSYTVRFYNGTTLLQTVNNVPYGGTATYTGSTPVNNSTGNPADFEFYGWSPSPTNIQGDTNCYAQYHDLREITDSWATIAANVANGTATSKYGIGAFKSLEIGAVVLPYDFYSGSAVVYNNEIHILGCSIIAYNKYHYKWNGTEWISVSTLPYNFRGGCAVVYDNEIHILGSDSSSYRTLHYKWNGTEWISVSTLPYNLYLGSAVVYNDELHILGGTGGNTKHYKWNGTEWASVSTLPYTFNRSFAAVYNNEIHIMGTYDTTHRKYHYKWNGTEWISVSTLPYNFYDGSAVVYNEEIHILGGADGNKKHYKWNGTSWISESTLPYEIYMGSAVVYNDEIHILGGYNSAYRNGYYKYSIEESKWTKYLTESIPMHIVAHNHDELPDGVGKWGSIGDLPYQFSNGEAVVLNNEIHILGSSNSSGAKNHYKWDGTEWVYVSTLPYKFYNGSAVVLNGEIHIMGGYASPYTRHYKWNGTEWISVSTLPYDFYEGSAVVYNNEIHIIGSESSSDAKKHYKWNGTEWVSVSTLPYAFCYGSAIVLNNEIHILGANASSYRKSHYKWNGSEWVSVSTLPYDFNDGSAVVLNNEIYILGANASSYRRYHYKWNGSEWVSVSTLPYEFYNGCVLVYNDKVTLLGSLASSASTNFYSLSTATFELTDINPSYRPGYNTSIVEYKGEIHHFYQKHRTYNGSEWVEVGNLPYGDGTFSCFIVYNNEIHMLGNGMSSGDTATDESNLYHYKYDGTSWTFVSTLPYPSYDSKACVLNGELYVGFKNRHFCKWDGSTWTELAAPWELMNSTSSSLFVYNNEIYHAGGSGFMRKYVNNEWIVFDDCTTLNNIRAFVYNNKIYGFNSDYWYEHNGNEWIIKGPMPGSINYPTFGTCFCEYRGKIIVATGGGLGRYYALTNPKATLTFVANNLLKDKVYWGDTNWSAPNKNDWPDSALRTWCNGEFLAMLPTDLQTAIQPVIKLSNETDGTVNNIIVSSNDSVWIPSIEELGVDDPQTESVFGLGHPYDAFTDAPSRKRATVDGSFEQYIIRNLASTNMHYGIASTGYLAKGARGDVRVLIGFCL